MLFHILNVLYFSEGEKNAFHCIWCIGWYFISMLYVLALEINMPKATGAFWTRLQHCSGWSRTLRVLVEILSQSLLQGYLQGQSVAPCWYVQYKISVHLHCLTATGSSVRSWAQATALLEFCMFSLCSCGFLLLSTKHAGKWTGYSKLPLGVNEWVNVFAQCPVISASVKFKSLKDL